MSSFPKASPTSKLPKTIRYRDRILHYITWGNVGYGHGSWSRKEQMSDLQKQGYGYLVDKEYIDPRHGKRVAFYGIKGRLVFR